MGQPFSQQLFAERLYSLRSGMKLTQAALGYEAGLGASQICNYERGLQEPGAEALCKLADYFGISADYLCGRTNEMTLSGGTS